MTDPWQLANAEANRLHSTTNNLSSDTMRALLVMLSGKGSDQAIKAELAKSLIGQTGDLSKVMGNENFLRTIAPILGQTIDPAFAAEADRRRMLQEQANIGETGATAVNKLGGVGLRLTPDQERALVGPLQSYISEKDRMEMQSKERVAQIGASGNSSGNDEKIVITQMVGPNGESLGPVQEQRTLKGDKARQYKPPQSSGAQSNNSSSSVNDQAKQAWAKRKHGIKASYNGSMVGNDGKWHYFFSDGTGNLFDYGENDPELKDFPR